MIDVGYYLFNAFGINTKPDRLMLPKWVNVSKERFNEILTTVTEAKNKGLKIMQMEEKSHQIMQKVY